MMNEVKDLLELALAGEHGPDQGQKIDVAGDLARGRRQLRRHRLTTVIGGSGVAAGVAAVAFGASAVGAVGPAGHGRGPAASATLPAAGTSSAATPARSIALVSYDGRKIPGYRLVKVPRGEVLRGRNTILIIVLRADEGASFSIAVWLRPADDPAPAHGAKVPVNGRPGFLRHQGSTETLTYRDSAGSWVDIQAPSSLGWHAPQFARFAAGIRIRGTA